MKSTQYKGRHEIEDVEYHLIKKEQNTNKIILALDAKDNGMVLIPAVDHVLGIVVYVSTYEFRPVSSHWFRFSGLMH